MSSSTFKVPLPIDHAKREREAANKISTHTKVQLLLTAADEIKTPPSEKRQKTIAKNSKADNRFKAPCSVLIGNGVYNIAVYERIAREKQEAEDRRLAALFCMTVEQYKRSRENLERITRRYGK